MTNVTVKLYASLADFLPAGAKNNAIAVRMPGEATVGAALAELRVPTAQCHLVLVNGIFVPPSRRQSAALSEGDVVAVWPPVAGG